MKFTFAITEPTLELPDALLREIGETMILFAYLEWKLSRLAYALLGVDRNVGRISVREPRGCERFDMVCELLVYKEISSKADLGGIRKRISECDDARNLLAHATWVRDPVHDALRLVKTSGQWQPTPLHEGKARIGLICGSTFGGWPPPEGRAGGIVSPLAWRRG